MASAAGLGAGGVGAGAAALQMQSWEPDLLDVLSDAAEELTQALAGKSQERSLRERRVSTGSSLAEMTHERVLAVLAVMDAQRAGAQGKGLGGKPAQGRMELAQQIARQPGKARQLAAELGSDETTQYLSLLEAAELLAGGEAGTDPDGRGEQSAREAAAELLAEHRTEILADINTVEATRDMQAGQATAFRTAYKDAVMGQDGLAATVRHLLGLVPAGQGADFLGVLEQMQQALGLDLAATHPSTEPARLQSLVSDLFHLKVIGTVVDEAGQLSQTLVKRHGVAPLSATNLTTELLMLCGERWVDGSRFESLGRNLVDAQDLGAQVSLHTGVRTLIRQLPVQVFPSAEGRQAVIDASQAALDTAIDREEGLI